jgi:hypothetical protein
MRAVPALTPIHDALAELESAAALVLLAEQEAQPIDETLPRLRGALATVYEARALAAELAEATGRPALRVIDGRAHSCGGPPAAA